MMKVSCMDLGVQCDYVATGETKDEVMKHLMEHGASAHAEMMAGMSESDKADLMKKAEEKMMVM